MIKDDNTIGRTTLLKKALIEKPGKYPLAKTTRAMNNRNAAQALTTIADVGPRPILNKIYVISKETVYIEKTVI